MESRGNLPVTSAPATVPDTGFSGLRVCHRINLNKPEIRQCLVNANLVNVNSARRAMWEARSRRGSLAFSSPRTPFFWTVATSYITVFGACSAFTHVTACTLAKSPSDSIHQRLQQSRCLHCCSDCYRVERTSSQAGIPPLWTSAFTAHTGTALGLERFGGSMFATIFG